MPRSNLTRQVGSHESLTYQVCQGASVPFRTAYLGSTHTRTPSIDTKSFDLSILAMGNICAHIARLQAKLFRRGSGSNHNLGGDLGGVGTLFSGVRPCVEPKDRMYVFPHQLPLSKLIPKARGWWEREEREVGEARRKYGGALSGSERQFPQLQDGHF